MNANSLTTTGVRLLLEKQLLFLCVGDMSHLFHVAIDTGKSSKVQRITFGLPSSQHQGQVTFLYALPFST